MRDPGIHPKEQRTRVLSATTVCYTTEYADAPKFAQVRQRAFSKKTAHLWEPVVPCERGRRNTSGRGIEGLDPSFASAISLRFRP